MNQACEADTRALIELADGRLSLDARRVLARRALHDPKLANELKLALRLADGSAELARDWIAAAAPSKHDQHSWWRPVAGAFASLAVVAAVLSVPRMNEVPRSRDVVALEAHADSPDQIGAGSFESTELFGGSFERD